MDRTGLAVLALLAIALIPGQALGATVSGTIFEWYTFEPLRNAVVEINTAPRQVQVAESGRYSFTVPPGDYNITAQYFEENRLKYRARERITVNADGDFTFDLVLFPPLDDEDDYIFEDFNGVALPPDWDAGQAGPGGTGNPLTGAAIAIAGFALGAAAIIFGAGALLKKATGLGTERMGVEEKLHRQEEALAAHEDNGIIPLEKPGSETAAENSAGTPPEKGAGARAPGTEKIGGDLREAVAVLKNCGGRLTQKELREKMPEYGEAKISLMVAELEEMGLVKKFKKGRGNIIVLK